MDEETIEKLKSVEGDKKEWDQYNYSPVEHFLIGSSIDGSDGSVINTEELMERAKKGDQSAKRTLLMPLNLQEKRKSFDAVEQEREEDKSKMIFIGQLQPIDFIFQINYLSKERKLRFFLEPSPINRETSEVVPGWKIGLVNSENRVVEDRTLLDQLKIESMYAQYFRLGESSENYRELILNL